MTDAPSSLRGSRSESTNDRPGSDDGGGGGNRPLASAGVAVTALSAALSGLTYGLLPDRLRIHWTLGAGPYYGPEFAPTPAVLIGFPALVAGLAIGAYWLDARLRRTEGFAAARPYYTAGVAGTLGVLLASQAALIAVAL